MPVEAHRSIFGEDSVNLCGVSPNPHEPTQSTAYATLGSEHPCAIIARRAACCGDGRWLRGRRAQASRSPKMGAHYTRGDQLRACGSETLGVIPAEPGRVRSRRWSDHLGNGPASSPRGIRCSGRARHLPPSPQPAKPSGARGGSLGSLEDVVPSHSRHPVHHWWARMMHSIAYAPCCADGRSCHGCTRSPSLSPTRTTRRGRLDLAKIAFVNDWSVYPPLAHPSSVYLHPPLLTPAPRWLTRTQSVPGSSSPTRCLVASRWSVTPPPPGPERSCAYR